ncbi:hypothetical protein [Nannocystis pusilla]|uniref:hypothetical protein n=1 Tax=Nannocystis pusilla TaxID=889268 RepID=UPI003B7F4940
MKPSAPGPFACAVFPLKGADAFADAWAREPAAATAGWTWAALRAPPIEVDFEFVMLRRNGRADLELVDRLTRSLGHLPAATFELVDGEGTLWWLSPDHPRHAEPLVDTVGLIDLLGNAALMMGSWAAAMAWPMD